jgi:phage terminase large subunit-like protein
LILNQRISSFSPFISRTVFESCAEPPEPLSGQSVFCGLDLSARTDLTAFVVIWQNDLGVWQVRPWFWTPEDGLLDRAKRDRVAYDVFAKQGFLETTPGRTVDYEWVATRIGEILSECHVEAFAFDRWRMDVFQKELDRIGLSLPLVPYGQGFKDQSPALDALEAAFLNAKIAHGDHPVLKMCASNAIIVQDPAGNRKLDKAKSTGRIDGMAALANAFGVAAANGVDGPSVYETRGVLAF